LRGSKNDHLSELRDPLVATLRKHAIADERVALDVTDKVIIVLRAYFKGERIYFGAQKYDAAAVLADFNGRNRDEVCNKHNIGKTTFYKILATTRDEK
jgi:Mor family transcriptional regulator